MMRCAWSHRMVRVTRASGGFGVSYALALTAPADRAVVVSHAPRASATGHHASGGQRLGSARGGLDVGWKAGRTSPANQIANVTKSRQLQQQQNEAVGPEKGNLRVSLEIYGLGGHKEPGLLLGGSDLSSNAAKFLKGPPVGFFVCLCLASRGSGLG